MILFSFSLSTSLSLPLSLCLSVCLSHTHTLDYKAPQGQIDLRLKWINDVLEIRTYSMKSSHHHYLTPEAVFTYSEDKEQNGTLLWTIMCQHPQSIGYCNLLDLPNIHVPICAWYHIFEMVICSRHELANWPHDQATVIAFGKFYCAPWPFPHPSRIVLLPSSPFQWVASTSCPGHHLKKFILAQHTSFILIPSMEGEYNVSIHYWIHLFRNV